MKGDKLASGARSAQFSVAPALKFNEGQMIQDLHTMGKEEFKSKYMIADLEYERIYSRRMDEERVSAFAEEMKQRAKTYEEELTRDAKQEASLDRPCFLTPFVPMGVTGRVIVSRDRPPQAPSKLAIPKSLRKDKTLLPTTGHIIKATMLATTTDVETGVEKVVDIGHQCIGWRVLFSPMSGTAICFKGYPTWIQLELSEILAIVDKEDVDLVEEELEPMV